MSKSIDWFGRILTRGSGYDNGEVWTAYHDVRLLDGLDDEEFEDDNEEARHQELWRVTQAMPLPDHLEILEDHTVWIYSSPETGIVQMSQVDGDDPTGRAGQVTVSLWCTDHWAEFLTHHHYDYPTREFMPALQPIPDPVPTGEPAYHCLNRLDLARVRYEAWHRCLALLGTRPAKH